MNRAEVVYTPLHAAHAEFYEWYEFDHLHVGDSLEDIHKKTMKKLRHQLLANNGRDTQQSKPILPLTLPYLLSSHRALS